MARHNNPNVHAHHNRASKYVKQNLTRVKGRNRQIHLGVEHSLSLIEKQSVQKKSVKARRWEQHCGELYLTCMERYTQELQNTLSFQVYMAQSLKS